MQSDSYSSSLYTHNMSSDLLLAVTTIGIVIILGLQLWHLFRRKQQAGLIDTDTIQRDYVPRSTYQETVKHAEELTSRSDGLQRELTQCQQDSSGLRATERLLQDQSSAQVAELAAVRQTEQELREQLTDTRTRLEAQKQQADEAKHQVEQATSKVAMLKDQLAESNNALSVKSSHIATLQQTEQEQRSEIVAYKKALEERREEAGQLRVELENVRTESRGLQERLNTSQQAIAKLEGTGANCQQRLDASRKEVSNLKVDLESLRAENRILKEKLEEGSQEVMRLQKESVAHFERTAATLLENKGQSMVERNREQLGDLLKPLREHIDQFGQQLHQQLHTQSKDTISLREAVTNLQQMNTQLSDEANNLASALRGNNKTQGDWGEWQLVRLLEAAGLESPTHYRTQVSMADQDYAQKRPDLIINLPQNRHLVVDSKVSLAAYERYCSCSEQDHVQRQQHAKDHLTSLQRHVKDLTGKNYPGLQDLNSIEITFLFVPVEPALGLAITADQNLLTYALEKGVVIVTASTLLATLSTVSYVWKQEKRKLNVQAIANQGGMLYDKFVSFTQDLDNIGKRLTQAQSAYQAAFNKLSESDKFGGTLLGRAERLRALGAKTKKKLGPKYLARVEALEEE